MLLPPLPSLRAFKQGKWRTTLSLQPEQKVRSSCGCLTSSGLQEVAYGYNQYFQKMSRHSNLHIIFSAIGKKKKRPLEVLKKLQKVKDGLLPWVLQMLLGRGWKTFPPAPWQVSRAKHSDVFKLFPQLVIAVPQVLLPDPAKGNFPEPHSPRVGHPTKGLEEDDDGGGDRNQTHSWQASNSEALLL